jgi:hypothetical protein
MKNDFEQTSSGPIAVKTILMVLLGNIGAGGETCVGKEAYVKDSTWSELRHLGITEERS